MLSPIFSSAIPSSLENNEEDCFKKMCVKKQWEKEVGLQQTKKPNKKWEDIHR